MGKGATGRGGGEGGNKVPERAFSVRCLRPRKEKLIKEGLQGQYRKDGAARGKAEAS